jgi:hypothetical protein
MDLSSIMDITDADIVIEQGPADNLDIHVEEVSEGDVYSEIDDVLHENSIFDYGETSTNSPFRLTEDTTSDAITDGDNEPTHSTTRNHSNEISFRGAGFCKHRGCSCHAWDPDYASKYCKCGHPYTDHY